MDELVSHPVLAGLSADLRVPGDKSISIRALILAALAQGRSVLHHLNRGSDVRSCLTVLTQLGAHFTWQDDSTLWVDGVGERGLSAPSAVLDCGNSGTTARLLMGLLAAQPFASTLVGDDSLSQRPMAYLQRHLAEMGADIQLTRGNYLPARIRPVACLRGAVHCLEKDSSQLKTSLLLAALFAVGDTLLTGKIFNRDHLERLLRNSSYPIELNTDSIRIPPLKQPLSSFDLTVAGDISSAAFLLVAAALVPGSYVKLRAIGVNRYRTGLIEVMQAMGVSVGLSNQQRYSGEPVADIEVNYRKNLKPVDLSKFNPTSLIDEIPVLAVLATQAKGVSHFRGVEALRTKECDRIQATCEGLRALGVSVEEYEDGFSVRGPARLRGGEVASFEDHRIAMAFLVAGAVSSDSIIVSQCDNVRTSFPEFSTLAGLIGLQIEKGSRVAL